MAARYLAEYIHVYRRAYERFTAAAPDGPGYPRLPISPYLGRSIDCLITLDGALILKTDSALACFSDPRMHRECTGNVPDTVSELNFMGQQVDQATAAGDLPPPVSVTRIADDDLGIDIRAASFDCRLQELLLRLTYGGFSHQADPATTYFWMPMMVRNLVVARGSDRRYLEYLEVLDHADTAAWDIRTTLVRAHADVNRDFVAYVGVHAIGSAGGTISLQSEPEIRQAFGNVLSHLERVISEFERVLDEAPEGVEASFHQYLETNPIILDLYASKAVSKPRFEYPERQADTDKTYVEPDFVLELPDQRYRLIELERPRTPLARRSGEGRAETSHAAFQVAEWRDFIERYPQLLQDRFPNMIASNVETLLVVGRDLERAESPSVFRASMTKIRNQYGANDIVTYDGLVRRARQALASLQALNVRGLVEVPTDAHTS